jgi:hypothetical protein
MPFGATSTQDALFDAALSPVNAYNTGFVGDGVSVSGEGAGATTTWTAR